MTTKGINVEDDKRRIYGAEGAADDVIPGSVWRTGISFNVLKPETKVDSERQKWNVIYARPWLYVYKGRGRIYGVNYSLLF